MSVALEALKFDPATRPGHYQGLRTLRKQGKSKTVLQDLEPLAAGRPSDAAVWRELRSLRQHPDAHRVRDDGFRSWRLPLGRGAIEGTIRRVINLRLKGNRLYGTEENAAAVFQLGAGVVSGRWEEAVEHPQEAMARDRRTA